MSPTPFTPFTRCNLVEYRAAIDTLGNLPDVESILPVLDKLGYLIVDKQVAGPANDKLVEVLNALATINSGCKVFGRIDLTAVPDLASATALVDAWTTDVPIDLLAGFLLVGFEFQMASVDRAIQNGVVDYVHALEKAVCVDSPNLYNVFEPYPAQPAPTFGRTPTIRDYVLMRGHTLVNQGLALPSLAETPEHRTGRLEYLESAKVDRLLGLEAVNFGVLALVGAGDAAFLTDAAFKAALKIANEKRFDGIGIQPDDQGDPSHRFFLTATSNQVLP